MAGGKRNKVVLVSYIDWCQETKKMTYFTEVYADLKVLCDEKGWNYNTISAYKLPFEKDGLKVERKIINR